MKQMDLIVQKDNETKRLNDTIRNLEERLANLNILLGGKDEALKNKDNEIKRVKEESKDSQKVIIKTVSKGSGPWGSPLEETKRVNLKDVEDDVKKAVEKETKKSIAELENTQLDLEIKIESLERELSRRNSKWNADLEDMESKLKRKHEKVVDGYKEEIEDLKELRFGEVVSSAPLLRIKETALGSRREG